MLRLPRKAFAVFVPLMYAPACAADPTEPLVEAGMTDTPSQDNSNDGAAPTDAAADSATPIDAAPGGQPPELCNINGRWQLTFSDGPYPFADPEIPRVLTLLGSPMDVDTGFLDGVTSDPGCDCNLRSVILDDARCELTANASTASSDASLECGWSTVELRLNFGRLDFPLTAVGTYESRAEDGCQGPAIATDRWSVHAERISDQ